MAKHADTFLYLRVRGKTLDNLQDLLSDNEELDIDNRSVLSIVLEKALDYWVYEAVKGKLIEKYGDMVYKHRDPDWKPLKQQLMEKRSEKEAVKKAKREGDYE